MFNIWKKISNYILVISFSISLSTIAQPVQIENSSQLQLSLEKFNVLGSVLYIGAHPDDENTGLMAYFSKGKKYRTAYLSLTRGDGGQNLIGPEKGSAIGILRTQELLQARNIDGGEQYFTRAVDFGYSKSPEETYAIWGKENILSDMVWVIRKFQPDVIVTRFPPGGNGGHGHHTASAALALEAFSAAADPNKFPEQLRYVKPWKTKRLFWNNWHPNQDEAKNLISVDVGDYNPLLGKSYTELAAESRSMHKSQGFGVSAYRGSRTEYFQLFAGEKAENDIFDGINVTWNRLKNGNEIGKEAESVTKSFDPDNPSKSLTKLVDLFKKLDNLEDNTWVEVKRKELLGIIQSCAGLWMEAIASDYSCAPGDEVNVKTTLVNRSRDKFKIVKVEFPITHAESLIDTTLEFNQPESIESMIKIPVDYPISQPYWLMEKPSKGLFKVSDQNLIGLAENPPNIPVKIYLDFNGEKLVYTIPLLYRWTDRVEGELYRPFEVRPPVTTDIADNVTIFPDDKPKKLQIKLKNNTTSVSGEVFLHADGNWKISPSNIPISFKNKYDENEIYFEVTPPSNAVVSNLKIDINIKGKTYNKALVEIAYPHIKRRVYFPDSDVKLIKLDLKKYDGKIGYIMGSGDDIPDCLRSLGYDVRLLTDKMIEETDLSQYDAIVAGIRAYNTRERLKYDQPKLMEYVKNGGTYIVQYNVSSGLQTNDIGPYPFTLSRDRVTDEDAKVNFIDPSQQLLNFPNKITQKDFDGWLQERGLYFADNWDSKYQTVIACHDPNETDLAGGMLFANYGSGVFIYSAYDWFRELPAGVPGAYRFFVNMISAGKYSETKPN